MASPLSPSVDVEKVVSGLWTSLQHNATLRRSVMKQVHFFRMGSYRG